METIIKKIWKIRARMDRAIFDDELIDLMFAMEEIEHMIQRNEHVRTETTCSMHRYSRTNSAVNIVEKEQNIKKIKSFLEKWQKIDGFNEKFPILKDDSCCPIIQIWNLRACFDAIKFSILEEDDYDGKFAQIQKIVAQLMLLSKNNEILNEFEREDLRAIICEIKEFEKKIFAHSSVVAY